MKLFGGLGRLFDDADAAYSSPGSSEPIFLMDDDVSNPANGLPMIGGFGGIDTRSLRGSFELSRRQSVDIVAIS